MVGGVSQIDNHLADIIKSAFGLLEQGIDIFPHALRLLADVADVQDVSFVVNACRSGDEDLATVAVVNTRASFKTDAIFIGGVQVGWRVEVFHLFFGVNANDGIVVELHQYFGLALRPPMPVLAMKCVFGVRFCV